MLPGLLAALPGTFELESPPTDGLPANAATDIVVSHSFTGDTTFIWLATSAGVARSCDFGETWTTFTQEDGLGRGGVSALTAAGPWVCAATVFDTSLADVSGVGGGISITSDNGAHWYWMEQPVDDTTNVPDYIDVPTTVAIENITYDLSIDLSDSSLWAASFAGGFRRYSFRDSTWTNVPPDDVPFGAYDNLNHRAFSALCDGGDIWLGSAGGLNLLEPSGDGYVKTNFRFDSTRFQLNGEPQITGNWVVALDAQPLDGGGSAIWVGGWATYATTGDYYGVSVTRDRGNTWEIVHDLDQVKVYNFAFDGHQVYAATDEGLYKSNADGAPGSWNLFPRITDRVTGRVIWLEKVYSVNIVEDLLLVGTADGLAVSGDNGRHWHVEYREPVKAVMYPSPFSPSIFQRARLVFDLSEPARVTVRIFDFALDPVKTLCDHRSFAAGNGWELYWDGTNLQGNTVADGVYFYSFQVNDGEPRWNKIMVVK